MKKQFRKDVISAMDRTKNIPSEILSEKDLEPLPEIVQKYIRLCGFVGKEKIRNFISHDRFETNGKEYISNPWVTPVLEYRQINGYQLPSKAQMIYKRSEGDFCYEEFELESMAYNVKKSH